MPLPKTGTGFIKRDESVINDLIDICIKYKVAFMVSALNLPEDWVRDKFQANNIKVGVMAGAPEHAKKAID